MTAPARKPPLSESAFQRQVIELANLHHWLVHHARPALTKKGWRTPVQGHVGFPDLVLCRPGRPGRLILAELKAEKGALSGPQERWLDALRSAYVEVYVWRPSDWPEIEECLR